MNDHGDGTHQPCLASTIAELYDLGFLHHYGSIESPPNIDKAVAFYKQAADQGDGHSMYQLGVIYAEGLGNVGKDVD